MNVRFLTAVLFLFGAISLIGCGSSIADQVDQTTLAESEIAGLELYDQKCTVCHSIDGSEKSAPSLQGIATNAGTRTDQTAEAYLLESIINPSAYVVDGYKDAMPKNYADTYSDAELQQLISFLLTLE